MLLFYLILSERRQKLNAFYLHAWFSFLDPPIISNPFRTKRPIYCFSKESHGKIKKKKSLVGEINGQKKGIMEDYLDNRLYKDKCRSFIYSNTIKCSHNILLVLFVEDMN